MAVTTSSKKPRQAQSKAKSLSDLEQLLKRTQPLNEKETTMNTATEQAAYSTTETTTQESTMNASATSNQEAKMAAFFQSLVDEITEQTKTSVDQIGEHLRSGLEPLTKQIADNIVETGEIKQKLTSVEAEMEKIKKDLAAAADETGGAAFAMYPTSMEELMTIADEGKLMPPKSTWFEPKLRSGLFIHKLSD